MIVLSVGTSRGMLGKVDFNEYNYNLVPLAQLFITDQIKADNFLGKEY